MQHEVTFRLPPLWPVAVTHNAEEGASLSKRLQDIQTLIPPNPNTLHSALFFAMWTCSACTLWNQPLRQTCEACGTAPGGTWQPPPAAPQPYAPQYPQAGYPQPNIPQPNYPQPGYPQPGYPPAQPPTSAPQPGYPQPGYPAAQPATDTQQRYPPPPPPPQQQQQAYAAPPPPQQQQQQQQQHQPPPQQLAEASVAAVMSGLHISGQV